LKFNFYFCGFKFLQKKLFRNAKVQLEVKYPRGIEGGDESAKRGVMRFDIRHYRGGEFEGKAINYTTLGVNLSMNQFIEVEKFCLF